MLAFIYIYIYKTEVACKCTELKPVLLLSLSGRIVISEDCFHHKYFRAVLWRPSSRLCISGSTALISTVYAYVFVRLRHFLRDGWRMFCSLFRIGITFYPQWLLASVCVCVTALPVALWLMELCIFPNLQYCCCHIMTAYGEWRHGCSHSWRRQQIETNVLQYGTSAIPLVLLNRRLAGPHSGLADDRRQKFLCLCTPSFVLQ